MLAELNLQAGAGERLLIVGARVGGCGHPVCPHKEVGEEGPTGRRRAAGGTSERQAGRQYIP